MRQASVYTSTGRATTPVKLPKEIFGQEGNPALVAQAVRVYQWQEHRGRAKVKTRSEVARTGAKVWRQKGTGRARHGSRRAPIFVGGGVAHGPTGVRRSLTLTKKLARKALFAALSDKLASKEVYILDAGKTSGKAKEAAVLFKKLGVKKALVLYSNEPSFVQSCRNIPQITLLPANLVNAYVVLRYPHLLITKGGLELLTETFKS